MQWFNNFSSTVHLLRISGPGFTMKGARSKAETKKAHSNTWLCNPLLAAETSWKDAYGGGFELEMALLLQCQVMESDAVRMRDGGPFIFAQVKNGV